MIKFKADQLRRFSVELLNAGGFNPEHAEDTADVLVWANSRGFDSHGVLRIPRYVEMVAQGRIDPLAQITTLSQSAAVLKLDAANMAGATAMCSAMDGAIQLASKAGIGWCSVKNITHAGAVGYYAMRACKENCIGLVMSASGPLMAYHGARVSGLSTNPISIAVPSEGNPLLLDMSTSNVALGKIMQAKDAGSTIPADWGIDDKGNATTDPNKVATLTPLGGPKGSGLSLMIEILASVLVSNPVLSEALNGGKAAMNGIALAINVSAFGDPAVFATNIVKLAASLKGLPSASGVDEILLPGERGFRQAETRMREGIPLATGTVGRLVKLAEQLGVSVPTEDLS